MKIVFTNGCFDILHPGHVRLLEQARKLGDKLVVGLNSDASVRQIKGNGRPYVDQESRKQVLLGLRSVDDVIIFDELTPQKLIEEIKPDVLVKGGDWKPDEIIGADIVRDNGGEVVVLDLVDGHSTSSTLSRIKPHPNDDNSNENSEIRSIDEHLETIQLVKQDLIVDIRLAAKLIIECFRSGNKVLLCGNGGSAADAQHIAAEFVGRYEKERRSLPAVALTTDTSALTALTNDYDFDRVFTRQIESLAREGDCLIAISTSGNSSNVIAAVMEARRRGCKVIGFTGADGKKLASLADVSLIIPAKRTARIQEAHIMIAHIICEMVDEVFD